MDGLGGFHRGLKDWVEACSTPSFSWVTIGRELIDFGVMDSVVAQLKMFT